jgi:hypothetical protein
VVVICASHRTAWATEGPTEHLGEDVVGVGALGRCVRGPEPVEILTLLWVAQDLISLLDLFELLRVTAFVRVVFSGKFAIGLLDVISCGVPCQT